MPPQAEFYTVVAGTNVLPGSAASQLLQTEYARVYNLRFDDIANHTGDIQVYWNGELTYSGPADATPGEDAVSVYVIGSGYQDTLEIVAADGSTLPDPGGLEMVALDYADWSMIESRDSDGQAAPGAPEIPPEVAEAAAASGPPDDSGPPDTPPDTPPDPTGDYLSHSVDTQPDAMYSLRFESPGGFDVYWNDELISTVAASDQSTFTQLYLEGTGNLDTLEIEPHEGAETPDLSGFDLSIVIDDESADLAALLLAAVPVEENAPEDDPEDDVFLI